MSELWSNHYSVNKPRCLECLGQGINKNEYKFCSTERKPLAIYDEYGRKLLYTFEDIYACNAYHWTLFQGQGKAKQG